MSFDVVSAGVCQHLAGSISQSLSSLSLFPLPCARFPPHLFISRLARPLPCAKLLHLCHCSFSACIPVLLVSKPQRFSCGWLFSDCGAHTVPEPPRPPFVCIFGQFSVVLWIAWRLNLAKNCCPQPCADLMVPVSGTSQVAAKIWCLGRWEVGLNGLWESMGKDGSEEEP